jgi:virginiamycin B lyase
MGKLFVVLCSVLTVLAIPGILPAQITIVEFPVATAGSGPFGITDGPDGNIWFAEQYGNKVGRITPNGVITEFGFPGFLLGIIPGSDGNIWFTDGAGKSIGRITTDGVVTN